MASRRFIKPFFVGAVTSFAAAGMILSAAPAFADDPAPADASTPAAPTCLTPASDGTCPLPGTATTRSAVRGVAQAGVSTVTGSPIGTAYTTGGSGGGVSKGAGVAISDGNAATSCYSAAVITAATCGLPSTYATDARERNYVHNRG